jgi:hypothetical protein
MTGLNFHYSVEKLETGPTVRQHVSFFGLHHLKNFSFWHLFDNNFLKYYEEMDIGLFSYKNVDLKMIKKYFWLRDYIINSKDLDINLPKIRLSPFYVAFRMY